MANVVYECRSVRDNELVPLEGQREEEQQMIKLIIIIECNDDLLLHCKCSPDYDDDGDYHNDDDNHDDNDDDDENDYDDYDEVE